MIYTGRLQECATCFEDISYSNDIPLSLQVCLTWLILLSALANSLTCLRLGILKEFDMAKCLYFDSPLRLGF